MRLTSELYRGGGIMRASELQARGFSVHALRTALAKGEVIRPQRGWIALRSADPELVYAVERGVLLSCVSVTARLGLWRKHDDGPHFAVRAPHAHAPVRIGHPLHWGIPVRRREPGMILDSIENALNYVASCQPPEEALAVWESALNRGLVTLEALRGYQYIGRAKEILLAATPFSDSGVESYVMRRLRSLRLRFVAQAFLLGHRVDFLIEGWLVLQIDGGHHTGEQRDADNRHDAELALNGYRTIRVGYHQVFSAWPEVQESIMRAISQGRPRSSGGGSQFTRSFSSESSA